MQSGTYWEYFCPGCGWAPSEYIGLNPTSDQSAAVKKRLEDMVTQHNKKCKKFKQQKNG